jgi:hypothetical protein
LKELNYRGKKDEKYIRTFMDNLPIKTVVKQEMKGKEVPEPDNKSEDKPEKDQPWWPTEVLWNRMIELTKKIEEIETREAERQKREIEEKRNAQVRDAEFLLKMYKDEHERRRLFNENLKKEIDKLAKKGGKGRTAEFSAKKQEYFQPEKLIGESYDSEIIDEVLNRKADELIEQDKDKEFAVSTETYNALILAEPKMEENFKGKLEETGYKYRNNRFMCVNNIGYSRGSSESSSAFKKDDPVMYYFDNHVIALEDILNLVDSVVKQEGEKRF